MILGLLMTEIAQLLSTAIQHHQTGQLAEAKRLYQEVLHQQPDQANALYFLGLLAHQTGDVAGAIAHYQRAIVAQPDYGDAHNNLGAALQQQGKLELAVVHYQKALRLNPNNPNAQINLGTVLQQQGKLELAISRYEKALRLQPDLPEAHRNLGHARKQQGNLELAIVHYRRALELAPTSPEAYQDLADALQEQGQFEAALALYDRAIAQHPQHVKLRGGRIRTLLISGNLQAGFAEYDPWRLNLASQPRQFTQPVWDGSTLQGKSILLYTEAGAGFGDIIQFVRYVPLVAQRGGRVRVECQEPLLRLLRRLEGVERVVMTGQPVDFEVQASLLSLPSLFATTLNTIPARVPYLVASKRPSFVLAAPETAQLKVGLVWGGNPEHLQDQARSCPLAALLTCLRNPKVAFYSLQKGPHQADLTKISAMQRQDIPVQDLSDRLGDFADTATAIAQLDLVISVDTAVAHLAGAMGKPVWILLSCAADWRWLMGRQDSPWYPTVRLFRQSRRHDWTEVCDQIADALDVLVKSR